MLLSIRSILVLAIVACGFAAADLATDQRKKCTGGLPVGSGTLAEVDLDPKTLNSRREI
ncbi:hypothetical protein PGT21_024436 [Puccinia graminis f. sp. tritici]|uniref:Uncharacterized protein n=1 Tax=Puccinia graminis f. sp. tritici TaxID=56615 RepID=A0A5B0P0Z5_PUCGR|nr:hypothetical protein PGT21_024436 [Puccinia graminis f. sp. tritici]